MHNGTPGLVPGLSECSRTERALLVGMLAVASAAVGYEVGSVAAGDPLQAVWLAPILGGAVAVAIAVLGNGE